MTGTRLLRRSSATRRIDALAAGALRLERDRIGLDQAAAASARYVLSAALGVRLYDRALLQDALQRLDAGEGTADALSGLPPLRRFTVRSGWRQLLAPDPGPVHVTSTSGTGGTRTTAVKPETSSQVRAAIERRWYVGLGLPERLDVHIGVPLAPNLSQWRPFHDSRVRQRDIAVADLLGELGDRAGGGPSGLLLSQPDILQHLAERADRHGWGRLQAVASSFELFDPIRREALEATRAPLLTEMYCAADICTPLAFAWPGCTGLHVNEDTVHVEVLGWDDERRTDGEPGRLAVTDLLNTAMPLIRYLLGDLGVLSPDDCNCGRRTRTLRLLGRESTSLRLGSKRIAAGPALAAVTGLAADRAFLLEQTDAALCVVAPATVGAAAMPVLRTLLPGLALATRPPSALQSELVRPGGLVISTKTRTPFGETRAAE